MLHQHVDQKAVALNVNFSHIALVLPGYIQVEPKGFQVLFLTTCQ